MIKSTGFLSAAMLSGCLLSDGSELIPSEADTVVSTELIVGASPDMRPNYVWTIGGVSFLDVVRVSNQSAPVWGFNVPGGADVVQSPIKHGELPAGATLIGGSEPVLTPGVQYRVRIQRNTTNQQFSAVFTPPDGSAARLTPSALAGQGTSWQWGAAGNSQRGVAAAVNDSSVDANGLGHVVAIAAGGHHNLAIDADGGVWSWGANDSGQLGTGNNMDSATPARVTGLPRITAVAAGERHSLALSSDGSVWAWGDNSSSQVGDGTTVNRNAPVRAEFLGKMVAVAAGKLHSMALAADGTVWSWGGNYSGQLGNGTTANGAQPAALITQ